MLSTTNPVVIYFLLWTAARVVHAQNPALPKVVDRPNRADGFCYYCSDDTAPPLCNRDCTQAINQLCGQDLTSAMNETVNGCQILYLPPSYEYWRKGAHPQTPNFQECTDKFKGILNMCGKDASNGNRFYDVNYCTTSGGGGTYGWNDDGSPLEHSARYRISTPGSDQCGQTKAFWWQATNVIQWDPSWIPDNAQVVLNTNPPPLDPALQALATAEPTPDPACNKHSCDIYGKPVYADDAQTQPWAEGGRNHARHRIRFAGLNTTTLLNSINARCGQQNVGNPQVYPDPNGSVWYMDLDLPNKGVQYLPDSIDDACPCIMDAVYDASGGALVNAPQTWCQGPQAIDQKVEFPNDKDLLKKRGINGALASRFRQAPK